MRDPRPLLENREYTPSPIPGDVVFGKICEIFVHYWKTASTPPPPIPGDVIFGKMFLGLSEPWPTYRLLELEEFMALTYT